MSDSTVIPVPVVDTTEPAVDHGWKVILFNDDVHDFAAVVFALQRAAGLSLEVAEMVAFEAHTAGEAIVKRGLSHDDAEIICAGLRKWTRIDGYTEGVGCDVQKDDA